MGRKSMKLIEAEEQISYIIGLMEIYYREINIKQHELIDNVLHITLTPTSYRKFTRYYSNPNIGINNVMSRIITNSEHIKAIYITNTEDNFYIEHKNDIIDYLLKPYLSRYELKITKLPKRMKRLIELESWYVRNTLWKVYSIRTSEWSPKIDLDTNTYVLRIYGIPKFTNNKMFRIETYADSLTKILRFTTRVEFKNYNL